VLAVLVVLLLFWLVIGRFCCLHLRSSQAIL